MNASSPASPFGAGAALSQPRFLSIADTPREDVVRILDEAMRLREERRNGKRHDRVLAGKTLAMLFEKPSLRTRASFEQAVVELGGHAMVLGQHEVGLGVREPARDVAAVLSGMVDGLAARVFEHDALRELADHADVPVINMLSDLAHPCQALADALTIVDAFGRDLSGRMVSFIGDGNNVARSLAMICGRLGMNFTLASPPDYALEQAFADRLMARAPDMDLRFTHDPEAAVRDADVIYTDTFVSMGQEDEKSKRMRAFEGFQVSDKLLAQAPRHAIVMHCMPAYRGIEISAEVFDGPRCRAIPQAHNRLHAQKGLLSLLMGG
ncbi:MAG: ornithine carbamoyltransferase [Phycisphaeraceae bacterium]